MFTGPRFEARPQRPQVVGQLRHLRGQVGVGHRVAHQLAELLALLGRQRRHHPVGGGLPAGQRVDQLVDVLRVLREQVAVLVHELPEPVLGVLAARVRGQQPVEVGEHVLDRLHRLGVRVARAPASSRRTARRAPRAAASAWIDSYVARASSECQSYVASARTAPAVSSGSGRQLHLGPPGVVALVAGEGVALLRRAPGRARPGPGRASRRGRRADAPRCASGGPWPPGRRARGCRRSPGAAGPQRLAQRPAGEHVAARARRAPPGRRTAARAGRARRARGRSGTARHRQAP